MPIETYNGKTFVAFVDISGFKHYMKHEPEKAVKAIDSFFHNGYSILKTQHNEFKVEGIFVSDCCILFVRNETRSANRIYKSFKSLLDIVKQLNIAMLRDNFMVTTSIAYGEFSYQDRIEFTGITKNPIISNAYISAYLNSEVKPKIKPGQCRIVKEDLPKKVDKSIYEAGNIDIIKMIRNRKYDTNNYYYYWTLDDSNEIDNFEINYTSACKLDEKHKYDKILDLLKNRF
ncbi:hypothetical protein [Methanolobus sp. ZRKC5]|uniref:hypothetical protein n=1 Tax=unclassified Methanolobus TaxID=2629569 RepID=UPI00313BC19A